MTWEYDPSLATEKDQIRLLIGDTDADEELLQDEEIVFLLGRASTLNKAAATACEAIAAKFARLSQRAVSGNSWSLQQRFEHYRTLAGTLREADVTDNDTAAPIVALEQDPVLYEQEPIFRRHMDEVYSHVRTRDCF